MKNFLLIIVLFSTLNLGAQVCSDLFISEYVEGPGNNNAIEIYNPTSTSIDLAGYTVNRYSNGASSAPEVWSLSGSVAPGDVVVVGNGQVDSIWVSTYWSLPVDPDFYVALDDYCTGDYDLNSTFYFNGDDAMTLEYNGSIVDIFGKVGEDPGSAWTDDASAGFTDINGGTWWSKRQTLIRKPTVQTGVVQNPIQFNPTLEYDSLPDATYSNLGSHNCNCNSTNISDMHHKSYVMFPNPANFGDDVVISSDHLVKKIMLINSIGQKIYFKDKISTCNLSRGSYIIHILFENGDFAKNKLVVK